MSHSAETAWGGVHYQQQRDGTEAVLDEPCSTGSGLHRITRIKLVGSLGSAAHILVCYGSKMHPPARMDSERTAQALLLVKESCSYCKHYQQS
ncbi:hypothetical protein PsYK624_161170 [Phanerochaete sordida]|uniref:Uncharacterized protein n=1 Tax=Phanerochaete sordida TaxID=48140 RepID=A0A9P3GQ75_9APHY|nr:hypothetical protein PsYK624_161170 [Phanerochaete sordida]